MTSQYFWARIAGPDPKLRAADADRERVAERLRKSHAEGRLDMTEFTERLERCFQAKTLGELGELVSDLPRQDEELEHRSGGSLAPWRWRLGPVAPILIALILVSAAVGHHFFWLWIPLVFIFWRMSWRRGRRWSGAPRHRSDEWF